MQYFLQYKLRKTFQKRYLYSDAVYSDIIAVATKVVNFYAFIVEVPMLDAIKTPL